METVYRNILYVYFKKPFHKMDKGYWERRHAAVKKQKLNYRFHNPNPADVAADYILKVFMEVNEKKVEQAIKMAAGQRNHEKEGGCPA